jgi:hypothetical protein
MLRKKLGKTGSLLVAFAGKANIRSGKEQSKPGVSDPGCAKNWRRVVLVNEFFWPATGQRANLFRTCKLKSPPYCKVAF